MLLSCGMAGPTQTEQQDIASGSMQAAHVERVTVGNMLDGDHPWRAATEGVSARVGVCSVLLTMRVERASLLLLSSMT